MEIMHFILAVLFVGFLRTVDTGPPVNAPIVNPCLLSQYCCAATKTADYIAFSFDLPATNLSHRLALSVSGGTIAENVENSDLTCRWYANVGGSSVSAYCNAGLCVNGAQCPARRINVEITNTGSAGFTVTSRTYNNRESTTATLAWKSTRCSPANFTACSTGCSNIVSGPKITMSSRNNACGAPPVIYTNSTEVSFTPKCAMFRTRGTCTAPSGCSN
jgi:hypothetical protein